MEGAACEAHTASWGCEGCGSVEEAAGRVQGHLVRLGWGLGWQRIGWRATALKGRNMCGGRCGTCSGACGESGIGGWRG
jgi:hypothetical protein